MGQLFICIVLILIGFVLIIKGGDFFVDSAIWMAKKVKIPTMLIGATIVSIGTTMPEITVSITSAIQGDLGLAVSNAIGSMFCNLALILGLALTLSTCIVTRKDFLSKIIFFVLSVVLLVIFAFTNSTVSTFEAVVLLVVFVLYMGYSVYDAITQSKAEKLLNGQVVKKDEVVSVSENNKTGTSDKAEQKERGWAFNILMFFIGAVAVVIGSILLVNNISIVAQEYLHIPSVVVGFTVVAVGTSLPELVTSINAVKKKEIGLSIGNVMGANIINGTFLTGISYLIGGSTALTAGDISTLLVSIVLLAISVLILVVPSLLKQKTYRFQGIALLVIYVGYLIYLGITTFI